MEDFLEKSMESNKENERLAGAEDDLLKTQLIDFDELLRNNELQLVAQRLSEGALEMADFMKKDIIDRFLDFVFFKVQTGNMDIPSMAYPTKRMLDNELEKKVIELINKHLYPEIIFRLLKFFTRNVHEADTNLYIANLVYSEVIIKSIYDTYQMFKRDIFVGNRDKRTLNVKRIQQYSSRSENKLSSPLDAAARMKYILEFFLIKYDVTHLYTREDLLLYKVDRPDSD
ncbi:MAG: hypothetical protein A2176_13985 [Spirochaetes bacterium RBG_13_51_14]|nr:MAG: hypothetical protein A2176_13985 [Spirochaetes bacterium RBG_13_51_14]